MTAERQSLFAALALNREAAVELAQGARDAVDEIGRLNHLVNNLTAALRLLYPLIALVPHVQGCDQSGNPHCTRCVTDSELARIAEAIGCECEELVE